MQQCNFRDSQGAAESRILHEFTTHPRPAGFRSEANGASTPVRTIDPARPSQLLTMMHTRSQEGGEGGGGGFEIRERGGGGNVRPVALLDFMEAAVHPVDTELH